MKLYIVIHETKIKNSINQYYIFINYLIIPTIYPQPHSPN